MLVIDRHKNEKLVIGKAGDVLTEPVIINLCEVKVSSARIGIIAQRDIIILRLELKEEDDRRIAEGI